MRAETITKREQIWLWLALGATLIARVWFLIAHRVDSDEPQHLHVVWALSRGLIPYRDVFDNHLPLLHFLFAPLMAVMPESSSIFVLMRIAIAPIAIACGWLAYLAARPFWGPRIAAGTALIFSVIPPWLAKSIEFRNDTLWMFFWLAGLALLARAKPSVVLAGVAFGLSLLASIKAVPLLIAHVLAIGTQRTSVKVPEAMRVAFGVAIPLAVVGVVMIAIGALDEMIRGVLFFNASVPVHAARRMGGAFVFALVAGAIERIAPPVRERRKAVAAHLTFFSIWYVALLLCFWPILTPRDYLPLAPLAALAISSWLAERGAQQSSSL